MLANDTLVGPYRILSAIGAGGMGEVYRALDTRLHREVAVKVLSTNLTHDVEANRRFEQEARAAGQLNHPNILAIYDIGTEEGQRYIVSELLEGESLRARLRVGALSARKATDYAVQLARGLAAAHEKGIIHRDLKPENIFITRDGQVKILDFGLVKLMTPIFSGAHPVDEHAPTTPAGLTEPGRILGTVGYMAPEQIRGQSGDHRSDIFAYGAILYEMLAGRPAFRGDSPIESLNAILKDDPPEFADIDVRAPASLERIIRHCLEKNPDERAQSARDLAFHLGGMSGLTSQAAIPYARLPRFRARDFTRPLLALLVVAAVAAAAYWLGTRQGRRPPPSFKRITFRSGTIVSARFAPDGQSIFYGAKWAGNPSSVYAARADSPESRDLGFGTSDILSVSSTGKLAISLRRRPIGYLRDSGMLAEVPIAGGAPRELHDDVEWAEWSPDGKALAVVRTSDGRCRLEYPIGKVLHQTVGWISHPRFQGERIAFIEHPFLNDDRGTINVIDARGGAKQTVTPEYQSVQGLAWWPDRGEIWFSAEGGLHVVEPRRKPRRVMTTAGWMWLHDISRDGRMLASLQHIRAGIIGLLPGETRERDLSWLDYSVVRDLSADGKQILFSESGEAGGSIFGIYIRRTDGSPAIRLGEGTTESLSPDGKWVLSIQRNRTPAQILMLPTGAGQPRAVTTDAINHRNARWLPDGKRVVFTGDEPGKTPRLWVQSIDGGAPRAISDGPVSNLLVTRDGTRVLGRGRDRRYYFHPVDGGPPEPVTALRGGDVPVRFADDGSLFVGTFGRIPASLAKVDLATGERTPWREAMPADPAGLINVGPIYVTPDGKTTVYSYTRLLSDLYVVSNAR